MHIVIPSKYQPEREYIISVLFSDILGLKYTISIDESATMYKILIGDKKLLIADVFWSKLDGSIENYLQSENIPNSVFTTNALLKKKHNLLGLYGANECEISSNSIYIGLDIFASAFFMLSRWEEYVKEDRDKHDRFPAVASLSWQQGFLLRPIVDEYIDFLWKCLIHLGIGQKKKVKAFHFYNTHDIDFLYLFEKKIHFISKPIKALFQQGFKECYQMTRLAFQSLRGKDPYQSFEKLMSISEKAKVKSYFFFMATDKTALDKGYNSASMTLQSRYKEIKSRGHDIGIHPASLTYDNGIKLQSEKENLEQATGIKINTGRQHFLKFKAPLTWRLWQETELKESFTLSYSKKVGFRTGTSYAFHPFDFLERKKLSLLEYGTTVMDESLVGADKENLDANKSTVLVNFLMNTIKRHKGSFVFLWHNSSFGLKKWRAYGGFYENTVNS